MRLPLVAALFITAFATTLQAAPPPCLEGDTLVARRALATLRATIDAGCPCEQPRRAYQRCAKGAIASALEAAALPVACRKMAKQQVKTSSCGLKSKAPCGRVHTSDGRVACALSSPQRCRDGRRWSETACTTETYCSDVVDWAAGTCHDVRGLGPYAPGVMVRTFTKPSEADGSPRALETLIWYPAPAGSGPIDPTERAVIDAPLDADGGPYPVVMFSHGSCGYARQSLFLTPLLASHGFVVVSVPHPGNQIFDFPQCGTPAAQARSFQERPADLGFVLDRMLALGSSPGSAFVGALDADRIGMMGHSFGGMDTYRVAGVDPRYRVAVPMAPAVFGEPALEIPTLTVLGGIDSVVDPDAPRQAFAAAVRPKYQVVVEHAGHYTVSDACFVGPDCSPPETLTQDEAHALALRYVLPFLRVHLAGDESFRPLLETAVPGVELTAER